MVGEDVIELCLGCSSEELKEMQHWAFKRRLSRFGRTVHFFVPGMVHYETPIYRPSGPLSFPAISVTGDLCHLQCKHCRGVLLKGMLEARSPSSLYELCRRVKLRGGGGCLISGGCLSRGEVPLRGFISTLRRVKEELGLRVVIHTGLPSPETVEALAEVGVDGVLLDVIGSDETFKVVYNLDRGVGDLEEALRLLESHGLPVIPHLVVGLHYGRLLGEAEALKMISRFDVKALVIVVLMPLEGTDMEGVEPPSPLTVARIITAARLLLGCARPRGRYKSALDVQVWS